MTLELVKRSKKVKEAKIEEKDQRWHTRNRIQLTFGSNDVEKLETYLYDDNNQIKFQEVDFHQAKSKAIEELLDNCIDEYYRGHVTQVNITVSENNTKVTVEDNGIGFDIRKIEDVYSKYRTGSKFKDEDVDEKGFLHRTLGQNGLGAAATCLTADLFEVTVKHYNTKKMKTVTFIDGALKIKSHATKTFKGHSGVRIDVVLSAEVYKDNIINVELLRKRIIDLAYNNPGLTFIFNGQKYASKKGLAELATLINAETAQVFGEDSFIHDVTTAKGKAKGKYDLSFSLAYDKNNDNKENFISFVNSTPTYDGGFHHDRFRRAFINAVKDKLERQAKKEQISFVDNDIVAGMAFVIGIVMPNPRFESQTKRKLVRDLQLEKSIDSLISSNVDRFFRKNSEYLEMVMERAIKRSHTDALKDAAKIGKKTSRLKIEKLLDANEKKERYKCSLFICEGDSAIGGLRSARNKLYQGGIALKGKPMNVSQSSLKDVINNQEFMDIMASIGLVIGEKADPKDLRFANIVFLADSDVDGGHINTLLTNFFYQFWPELFEYGCIQIAKAPLFEIATSSGKKIYAESLEELEQIKKDKRITIKGIQRNKGLGEMSEEAFKHVLSRNEYTKITVNNVKESKSILEICFGKDSQSRKDLLLAKNKQTKRKG